MDNNIGDLLTRRARLSPDVEAYVEDCSDLRLDFAALNARSNQLAHALLEDGLAKGDRVGLLLMNSVEFVEAFFAIAKIGAVVVPLNWRLVADELEFILKDSGVKRLVFGSEFSEVVAEIESRGDKTDVQQWLQVTGEHAPERFATVYEQFRDTGAAAEPALGAADDDLLYIMYTSGTTGLPKGVVHTHTTAVWAVLTICANPNYRPGDRYLAALPMFHVGALTPLVVNIYQGATTVVMRSFDPVRAWKLIEEEKITTGLAVPAMLNFMVQVPDYQKFDFSTLRWMMTGAAPVPPELTQLYATLDIEILQVYGLTETCGPACLMDSRNALRKPASAGRAFFHTDVKIVDSEGNECPPGEAGEVLVRGRHIMREYWNRPDATAETLIDGWLHTGDVAIMDDEGFVTIQDRIKDMIISGGENIYPAEVEAALMSHPGVREAAVIGQTSEKWGESPLAIVVKADGAVTDADIMKHCQNKLARYKQPYGVTFIDEIPRNPSGKILKRLLREQFPGPAPV
ncbi:MAG: long-chain-fatty-acid--CoA ligase [Pseudomonadota bacterium]